MKTACYCFALLFFKEPWAVSQQWKHMKLSNSHWPLTVQTYWWSPGAPCALCEASCCRLNNKLITSKVWFLLWDWNTPSTWSSSGYRKGFSASRPLWLVLLHRCILITLQVRHTAFIEIKVSRSVSLWLIVSVLLHSSVRHTTCLLTIVILCKKSKESMGACSLQPSALWLIWILLLPTSSTHWRILTFNDCFI